MGVLWGVLAVLAVFLWIVTLFDLFRRHLSTGTTVAWLLIVLILPFIGAIAYWAMRKAPEDEVDRALATERDIRRGAPPPRTR
jgi:hypothetical protein